MKKLSIFAVAIAAMAFTACGGNKSAQPVDQADSVKTFEQEQVEAKIKMELDSLASEVGKLKQLPFLQTGENGIKLTEQEKQVKPEYLIAPSVAENATTFAALYDMPIADYEAAIAKLVADINDPSFKDIEATTLYETGQKLYDAMNENSRINYFWQMASGSLVEDIYVMSQNSDKFLKAFNDESAANVTYRIILLTDAVKRLAEYDSDFAPVAKAIEALEPLNAETVDQLKAQLAETKDKIAEARNALIK